VKRDRREVNAINCLRFILRFTFFFMSVLSCPQIGR
jgi:hypothetical protein